MTWWKLRRCHFKKWFPEDIPEMVAEFFTQLCEDINLTTHGAESLVDDKCGLIPLPNKEELMNPQNSLVEIYQRLDRYGRPSTQIYNEKECGVLQKIAVRVPNLDPRGLYDYTYIVAREGFVVTAWANNKSDDHRLTESWSKYYDPSDSKKLLKKRKKRKYIE